MSDKYREVLQGMLPSGAAWDRDLDAELTAILQALAVEAQRVEDRGVDLIEEIDPRTTTELLPDWERVVGLPGDCQAPTVLAERQALLQQKLLGHGDPNLGFWQDQVEALGFTFNSIEEYQPYSSGDNAGDHCIGTNWTFSWVVSVGSRTEALNTLLQCTLESLAPLHTVVEVHWQPYAYFAAETAHASGSGDFTCAVAGTTAFLIGRGGGGLQTSPFGGSTWSQSVPAGGYVGTWYGLSFAALSLLAVGTGAEIQSNTGGAGWINRPAAGGYAGDFRACCTVTTTKSLAVGTIGEIQTINTSAWAVASVAAAGVFAGIFYCCAANADGSIIVIAGASGEIQYATDGVGSSWTATSPGESYTGDFLAATFANGHFWLVGENGEVQQSIDGVTWRRIPNDHTEALACISGDGVEGVLIGDPDNTDLYPRTRIGPEMLFGADISTALEVAALAIAVAGGYAIAVGVDGTIARAPEYGS